MSEASSNDLLISVMGSVLLREGNCVASTSIKIYCSWLPINKKEILEGETHPQNLLTG